MQGSKGGGIVEYPSPIFGDNHLVFHANAPPVRKIDARFDSDDHAFFQQVVLDRAQAGGFVDRQARAMAQAVAEAVSQTRFCR